MKRVSLVTITLLLVLSSTAQTRKLSLEEAIKLGIQNSKTLKLSQNRIDAAMSQAEQAKDLTIPSMKVSAGYSHALMLSRTLILPASNGQDPKSMKLPFDNTFSQAGISVNEPIFAGNRFRYAKESANLLLQMSKLDAEKDKDEIVYTIIHSYINYYKILQNQKIIAQNLQDIAGKLEEIRKFEKQGLAIRNDVLSFELQQSNIQLLAMDLESNRQIVNYSMNVLLGLPDSSTLQVEDISYKLDAGISLTDFQQQALKSRKEFGTIKYQDRLADVNIKRIQDEKLPTVGLAGNLYYINPTSNFFPKNGTYLAPLLVGVTVGWDISSLLQNKNKLTEAKIQKQGVIHQQEAVADKVKIEVNSNYLQYKTALEKIKLLQTAVAKAAENERITESRFHNNLASTTERIDAQTLLYQSRINLELAKADATSAYYELLNATGQINQ